MRKLIAGMKMSVDGKIEGPEGYADWVEASCARSLRAHSSLYNVSYFSLDGE